MREQRAAAQGAQFQAQQSPQAAQMGQQLGSPMFQQVPQTPQAQLAPQFQQAPQQVQASPWQQDPGQQAPAQARSAGFSLPDFDEFVRGGTIDWWVNAIVFLTTPANRFEAQFESAFLPVAENLEVHGDVHNLILQEAQRQAAQIQQATNTALANSQAAFKAQQAAHRQQQAAFDAYNDSISAARDSRHAAFRASSNAGSSPSAPDFSEAIRGVNTFRTSDGREVELSVSSDVAFENAAGDVVGGPSAFNPGADWTEIPRA